MTAADHRIESVGILVIGGHVTSRELAQEFGVCVRMIRNDIVALSYDYPIYTKQGADGVIFIMDCYKPYNNTLTSYKQENSKNV